MNGLPTDTGQRSDTDYNPRDIHPHCHMDYTYTTGHRFGKGLIVNDIDLGVVSDPIHQSRY